MHCHKDALYPLASGVCNRQARVVPCSTSTRGPWFGPMTTLPLPLEEWLWIKQIMCELASETGSWVFAYTPSVLTAVQSINSSTYYSITGNTYRYWWIATISHLVLLCLLFSKNSALILHWYLQIHANTRVGIYHYLHVYVGISVYLVCMLCSVSILQPGVTGYK